MTYDAFNQKLYFTANNWLNGSKELFAIDTSDPTAVQPLGANAIHDHLQADLNLFPGPAVLSGSASQNRLVDSPLPDILTGNGGADPFGLPALSDSGDAGFDVITGYGSDDHLDAPVSSADLTPVAGQASIIPGLATSDLLSAAVSATNNAQAFPMAGETGVFNALQPVVIV